MKKMYFLGGIPRSGSTLLGSLLSQHPDIYVSPTSPLCEIMCNVEKIIDTLHIQYTFDKNQICDNLYSSILENFYKHIPKSIIFDKSRSWGKNIDTVKKFIQNKPKIISSYRPIPEVLTSYISLIEKNFQKNNFIDDHLRKCNIPITNTTRSKCIWNEYVSPSYECLIEVMNDNPDLLCLVNYNSLVEDPQKELNKIYEFLEIPKYKNTFDNIYNYCCEEKDIEWGLKDLHTIRSSLSKISKNPVDVIGEENVKLYSKFNINV